MATTGQLGTSLSRLSNIQLAGGAAPAPPPVVTSEVLSPEITFGPPLFGAPWSRRLFLSRQTNQTLPPPALVGVQTYAPEIRGGPPLRGAPWLGRGPLAIGPFAGNPALPPAPPPPPPPPSSSAQVLFIPRVPEADAPQHKDRMRRFTEGVSAVLNSLLSNGSIVRTGIAAWKIAATAGSGVLSFMGRVGNILLTASDIGIALGYTPANQAVLVQAGGGLVGGGPLTGNVTIGLPNTFPAGFYPNVAATVDQYGRVAAATAFAEYGFGPPAAGAGAAGFNVYFDLTDPNNIQVYYKT